MEIDTDKSRFVRNRYENNIYNRRYNGRRKTMVSQQLKKKLPNSVFLDGDWCWDADPFQVTEETKVDTVNKNVYEIVSEILTL